MADGLRDIGINSQNDRRSIGRFERAWSNRVDRNICEREDEMKAFDVRGWDPLKDVDQLHRDLSILSQIIKAQFPKTKECRLEPEEGRGASSSSRRRFVHEDDERNKPLSIGPHA